MSQSTDLLIEFKIPKSQAASELLPLVYDELRELAASKLAGERPDHTLSPTALVHEVFLKIGRHRTFDTRGDFFRAAALAMRRILVDHARGRNAVRRKACRRIEFTEDLAATSDPDMELEALDEALDRLAEIQPRVAELVQLRHFAGLTVDEAAAVLGVAPRTADTWWAYARAWLATELRRG
jgi:RNA polymerase sigma factor (TIGR02999 family)